MRYSLYQPGTNGHYKVHEEWQVVTDVMELLHRVYDLCGLEAGHTCQAWLGPEQLTVYAPGVTVILMTDAQAERNHGEMDSQLDDEPG